VPCTARELCAVLHAYGVFLDGEELGFLTPMPAELEDVVNVLQTGVRAVLLGRAWWGTATNRPRVVQLNPAERVPADIEILAVEGDESWDRIRPDAAIDFPQLFAPKARGR
jgi:hypothetical protein